MKTSPFARQTLGVLVSEAGTNCLHHSPGGEILWGNELQTPELPTLLTLNYGMHIRVRLPERRIGKLQCRSCNQKKRKNPIKKGEFLSKHCSESFVIDGQAPCKKQQNGQEKKNTHIPSGTETCAGTLRQTIVAAEAACLNLRDKLPLREAAPYSKKEKFLQPMILPQPRFPILSPTDAFIASWFRDDTIPAGICASQSLPSSLRRPSFPAAL